MKRWKNMLTAALCICLMVLVFPATANAEDSNTTVVRYADGSYSVTTITYDDEQSDVSLLSGESTRRGTKRKDHYSRSGNLAWTFTLYGEFTYNGRTAEATDAEYSYDIYESGWSFANGSASYSGVTARASGEFNLTLSYPVSLSLTCSANGVLS